MAVRAYDLTTGRFLSRDPLGCAPLFFADNSYVQVGANPPSNADPSGQYRVAGFGSTQRESGQATNQQMARIVTQRGSPSTPAGPYMGCDKPCRENNAKLAHVDQLQHNAAGYALLAILADVAGALVEWAPEGTLGKLEAVVLIATVFVEALPYAGTYFGGKQLFKVLSAIADD